MMRIIVHHNSAPIKTYQFTTESVTIGRLATNTIPINSMGISRHHLKIERDMKSGLMYAEDLASLNGSFINNQKFSRMAFLSGTEIILGKYSLYVEFTDAEPAVQPIPPQQEMQSAPVTEPEPAPASPLQEETPEISIPAEIPAEPEPEAAEEEPVSAPVVESAPEISAPAFTVSSDATATSEHAASMILNEIQLMADSADSIELTDSSTAVSPSVTSSIPVVSSSDELELMEDNSHAVSFADPNAQPASASAPSALLSTEDDLSAGGNFVFTSSPAKKSSSEAEGLDNIAVNAVLIDLNRQVIYKINKTRMTFGSDKSADIFVESGVFSSDNLAALTVEDSQFTITKGNGKLKVNDKKVPAHILTHKDKIKIDNSEFSFMIKDNG